MRFRVRFRVRLRASSVLALFSASGDSAGLCSPALLLLNPPLYFRGFPISLPDGINREINQL